MILENISFLNPEFFWLLILLPIAAIWYYNNRKRQTATLRMSSVAGFKNSESFAVKIYPFLIVLRFLALVLIIVAMARPRSTDVSSKSSSSNGIDIVIATDVSGSMLARDLKPNRIEALKGVAQNFVKERQNDRIGLVLYAAEAYTKTPVTSDKALVINAIKSIEYDNRLQDGTAIGMGLATAVNRLKDSKAKSKVVVLMTDGVNNAGFIEPETAADIAKDYGIKVYTIGIGTTGMAESPYAYAPNGQFIFRMMPVEIDEPLMKSIARKTDGKYYRATSTNSLKQIYDEINKLETSKIEELKFYNYKELFRPFAIAAFALLLVEILLRRTIFRSFI